MTLKVLIGCEESGKVRDAFLAKGHDAWSCDLIPSRQPSDRHMQCDVIEAMAAQEWDIIILHPPCTALAVSGNRTYAPGKPKHGERLRALEWTAGLWTFAKAKAGIGCALENPVGVLYKAINCPAQYIQPYQFGHPETKKTGLWLHNLPCLKPTNVVAGREPRIWKMPPSPTRARDRSETYSGIAEAMADQWGMP